MPLSGRLGNNELVFCSDRTDNYELYLYNVTTGATQQLTSDPTWDSITPRVSPDRRQILFHRAPNGVADTDATKLTTWIMNADGSGLVNILPLGWNGLALQGHAEWWPDQSRIVFVGAIAALGGGLPQIWSCDPKATPASFTMLTNSALGALDPSVSPDGSSLYFTDYPPDATAEVWNQEVYSMPGLNYAARTRFTTNAVQDSDPYLSPAGDWLAWIRNDGPGRQWGLYRIRPDGSGLTAVASSAGDINSRPAWVPRAWSADPQGTIYFHRFRATGATWEIWKVRVDGSGLEPVDVGPGNNQYPSL